MTTETPKPFKKTLGVLFRLLRLRRKRSFGWVGKRAGIGKDHVWRIEREQRHPGLPTMKAMASALDANWYEVLALSGRLGPEITERSWYQAKPFANILRGMELLPMEDLLRMEQIVVDKLGDMIVGRMTCGYGLSSPASPNRPAKND